MFFQKSNKKITLEIDTNNLSESQVRLLKTVVVSTAELFKAQDESEYFELSVDILRTFANIIKHSSFALSENSIPYSEQAIEFALEELQEAIDSSQVLQYDV